MTKDHFPSHASLLIRLMAILYDSLLLFALLMIATLPFTLITGGPPQTPWSRLGLQLYLLLIIFLFFGWFWRHGGQTLGMRSWRLKLVSENGLPVSWAQIAVRWFGAFLSLTALGLGYLWILLDPEKRAWHDMLSHSRIIRLPKNSKKSGNTPE